jgi:hypothetical protein
VRRLDEEGRTKIVSAIDIIVAVFIFVAGIFVIILGSDILDLMSSAYYYGGTSNPFSTLPWIILIIGITTIIYGIKRLIDDVLRTMIKRNM